MRKPLFTMREALSRDDLLGTTIAGDSWKPWRILLVASAGETLTWWERRTFTKLTGRKREPNEPVDELIVANDPTLLPSLDTISEARTRAPCVFSDAEGAMW